VGPNEASRIVIGAALKVHSALGAGVLESVCDTCLLYELKPACTSSTKSASLKLSGLLLGLLLNFNVPHMRQGIRRIINGPEDSL
jgi:PD-(D/E)XK nuclease superfamily protein